MPLWMTTTSRIGSLLDYTVVVVCYVERVRMLEQGYSAAIHMLGFPGAVRHIVLFNQRPQKHIFHGIGVTYEHISLM